MQQIIEPKTDTLNSVSLAYVSIQILSIVIEKFHLIFGSLVKKTKHGLMKLDFCVWL